MAEPYHGNSLFVMVAVRQFVAHRGLLTEKKICGSVKVMVWSLIYGFDIFVSDKINPRSMEPSRTPFTTSEFSQHCNLMTAVGI